MQIGEHEVIKTLKKRNRGMLPIREQMAEAGRKVNPGDSFAFQSKWVTCQDSKIMHWNTNSGALDGAKDGTKKGRKGLGGRVMKVEATLMEWKSSEGPAVQG